MSFLTTTSGGGGAGAVSSVNTQTGAVVLTTSDIAEGSNLYYTNAKAIASVLTGYTSGAGTVASTDTILQAIQKLNGNVAAISGTVNITGTQTITGAKTFSTTLAVDTSAGTTTGITSTVSGATNALLLTNTAMGSSNNAIVRVAGTITSPSAGAGYSGILQAINCGNDANARTVYASRNIMTGGGAGATATYGVFVDNNVNGSSPLSTYNQTGAYGANFVSRGSNNSSGHGNVGVASTASGANVNVCFFANTDAAGGTSAKSVGLVANITSSGATVTAGIFSRITTLTSQASYETLPTVSAGAVISNGDTTSDILHLQDNTTSAFKVADGGDTSLLTGNLLISTAGKGLQIKEGSNAKLGQSVLVGGTVTVSNTSVTANSRIFLTHAISGGTLGILSVGTITASTSFVINSSNVLDTSTVNWMIVEPL